MREIEDKVSKITESVREELANYLHSSGPGGQRIVRAFMEEFRSLAGRSPQNDPTNLNNYLDFLEDHVKKTLDNSIEVGEDGTISLGICSDETLGFNVDRTKLKHHPTPTVWVVYLIRGIGGRYAFVSNETYFKKFGRSMPAEYAGGFLISKRVWENEGWGRVVGSFEQYEHPASGAPPVPFFRNVLHKIDMKGIVQDFFRESKNAINT